MNQNYWDNIYQTKDTNQVSWYQSQDDEIFKVLKLLNLSPDQKIIDVGSGSSILIDQLIESGYLYLCVLDLSKTALESTKSRLVEKKLKTDSIDWVVGDVCSAKLPQQYFDLWHDRAVFHFMVTDQQQEQYLANLKGALKKEGYLVMSNFAEDGPVQCSGITVQRYGIEQLQTRLGYEFKLIHFEKHTHRTPWDSVQNFLTSVWQYQGQWSFSQN